MQRQGDLLLIPTERLPVDVVTLKTTVVQAGEHSHRLQGGTLHQDPRGQLFVRVDREVNLVHEEHAPLALKPGLYRVQRQREYRPQRQPDYVND